MPEELVGPDGASLNGGGQKSVEADALRRSVIDSPTQVGTAPFPASLESSIIWMVASAADEFEPWGRRTKLRDFQLRQYYPTENYFTAALGIIASRNASFNWYVEGGSRTVARIRRILQDANQGAGWENFIVRLTVDLATQDNGAFIEIVRDGDTPDSPFIGINSLDSGRCWRTGDPENPVIYRDRRGKYHLLRWWEVISLSEMPTGIEHLYGMQICSLSRLLLASQAAKSMAIYRYEKISGRYAKALHLVKGFSTQQLQDALARVQTNADAQGFLRFVQPVLMGSHDPKAEVGHDTIDMASIPDGFNEENWFKHYIAIIAMSFQSDYQEFAPLPGGNLGTSSQSEVLHMKTRGKGPALFMKLMIHAMNGRIMPENVEFGYAEPDLEAQKVEAEVRKLRAEERQIRILDGELLPEEARQIAADAGDLPQEMLLNDVTPTKPPLRDVEQPADTTGTTLTNKPSV